MTDDEKLIDDAVQAFDDRGITAPPREHLSIALTAFYTSLSKCGCTACSDARRERTGLTDHDRRAVARALHEIVYSPGANFDRAVPGIQEHMLACADKVAAALPWVVPSGAQTAWVIHDGESIAHPVGAPCTNCGEPGSLRSVVGNVLCDPCVEKFTAWAQRGENR